MSIYLHFGFKIYFSTKLSIYMWEKPKELHKSLAVPPGINDILQGKFFLSKPISLIVINIEPSPPETISNLEESVKSKLETISLKFYADLEINTWWFTLCYFSY